LQEAVCLGVSGMHEFLNGTSAQKGYLVPFKVYIVVAKVIPRMCLEQKFSGEAKNIPKSVRHLTKICLL